MRQPSAKFFNLMELEDLAAGLIACPAFDSIARGAGDGVTLASTAWNSSARTVPACL